MRTFQIDKKLGRGRFGTLLLLSLLFFSLNIMPPCPSFGFGLAFAICSGSSIWAGIILQNLFQIAIWRWNSFEIIQIEWRWSNITIIWKSKFKVAMLMSTKCLVRLNELMVGISPAFIKFTIPYNTHFFCSFKALATTKLKYINWPTTKMLNSTIASKPSQISVWM